jgi:hypothetical protein
MLRPNFGGLNAELFVTIAFVMHVRQRPLFC